VKKSDCSATDRVFFFSSIERPLGAATATSNGLNQRLPRRRRGEKNRTPGVRPAHKNHFRLVPNQDPEKNPPASIGSFWKKKKERLQTQAFKWELISITTGRAQVSCIRSIRSHYMQAARVSRSSHCLRFRAPVLHFERGARSIVNTFARRDGRRTVPVWAWGPKNDDPTPTAPMKKKFSLEGLTTAGHTRQRPPCGKTDRQKAKTNQRGREKNKRKPREKNNHRDTESNDGLSW